VSTNWEDEAGADCAGGASTTGASSAATAAAAGIMNDRFCMGPLLTEKLEMLRRPRQCF
jgi:hypothetical protein